MKNLLKKALTTTNQVTRVIGHNIALSANQIKVIPHNLKMTESDMHAYASTKVFQHASELNNVEISFDFVLGMSMEMSAAYFPQTHTIVFSATTQQVMLSALMLGMKWETYVDCLIAHEMGHALDPETLSYAFSLNNQHSILKRQQFMIENMMQLEKNAEELGAQFAKDKKAFRAFSKHNEAAYNMIIKNLKKETKEG